MGFIYILYSVVLSNICKYQNNSFDFALRFRNDTFLKTITLLGFFLTISFNPIDVVLGIN